MRRTALVLFDIDGTLLLTGGASRRCMRRAAEAVFGERFRWGPITPGTLDPDLIVDLARRCGIEATAGQLDAYRAAYLAELGGELSSRRHDVRVLPGVRELLRRLRGRADVVTGVLTGNFRQAARLKLEAAELTTPPFPVIACAEDGRRRCDLVPAALSQFANMTGHAAAARQVVLVGDTPLDIECARLAGCRVLAVGTGRYTVAQLQAHGADRLVADLTDAAALESLIDEVTS